MSDVSNITARISPKHHIEVRKLAELSDMGVSGVLDRVMEAGLRPVRMEIQLRAALSRNKELQKTLQRYVNAENGGVPS